MKKGINRWAFRDELPLRDVFTLAHDAGFDGVELVLDKTGDITLKSTASDMAQIASLARETGVELYSLATSLYWEHSVTSDDPEIRESGIKVACHQMDMASALGCETILFVPGGVYVPFVPGYRHISYADAYDRALEAVIRLGEYAKKTGVILGVENVWNHFLLSPIEFRDFIDKADNSYIKAFFDCGNCTAFGFAEDWIRILGNRIDKLHFKDYRRDTGNGNLSGFVDLLSGDVDYIEVKRALDEIGYTGWATAEMLPPYVCYPEQLIYNTSAAMDRILGK
ncbi:MAG: sugar phosphate isomerase/epimerase [Clostridiales bacterium]|nr:sugar phosphate isomerase/epimerase [Clostridiales bacterium]